MFYFNYRCIFEYRKELTTILKFKIMKTLNVTFEITNEELFNSSVNDVDTSGLKYDAYKKSFKGSLEIEKEDGNSWVTTTGEFGANDYKDELGFILISE